MAALLSVGYTLDEIANDITGTTPACFEPSIDYCVVRIPRFAFEKFKGTSETLTTRMKAVGEVMSIGSTFEEALQKACRSLEQDHMGLGADGLCEYDDSSFADLVARPTPERIFYIAEALRRGWASERICALTSIDPWFISRIEDIDGIDVKNKTLIAACVAFGCACTSAFPVTGLRTITKADIDLFAAHGRTVKLLGRGVLRDGRYAVAVEPVALSSDTLEAHVPSNFNLVSLVGTTVGELKFYGQGAGMLPTGNAIVQDVIDYCEGRRPHYDFSADLSYDASLLRADYVLRTRATVEGARPFGPAAVVVRDVTAEEARRLLERACEEDAASFMAALPKEA